MSELETLRRALREDAARHYGRRRLARRRLVLPVLAAGLAALAIALVVFDLGASDSRDEVAATPTPPQQTPQADGSLKLAAAVPVAPDDPALDGLLGNTQQIVRAWEVRKLKGHVILSRRGGEWCLSAPDPATNEPDIERGSTCNSDDAIELGIGSTNVIVVPDGTKPPEITGADGKTEPLQPTDGLVVILSRPGDSRLTTRP
jgi:hypothetical protein